jgi:hypothetical protein
VANQLQRKVRALARRSPLLRRLDRLEAKFDNLAVQQGRLAAWLMRDCEFSESEFNVFSQFGEDGMIQCLIRHLRIPNKLFVEFGVESYAESNTRFLLLKDNWSGLIMDSSEDYMSDLRETELFWRHNLQAKVAFITRENINDLISQAGVSCEIGLLSIDIDGNDYWVWQAMNQVNPVITIVEYNHRFGPTASVTIPYRADFTRMQAHHSGVYFGASLTALQRLGKRKGFALVGCNSAGNNAFFVRRDCLAPGLRELTPAEAYVKGKFREARNERGQLAFLSAEEEQEILSALPVQTVEA